MLVASRLDVAWTGIHLGDRQRGCGEAPRFAATTNLRKHLFGAATKSGARRYFVAIQETIRSFPVMHPIHYTDYEIEAEFMKFEPPGILGNQYRLTLRSSGSNRGGPLVVSRVHLSQEALGPISEGRATGICMEGIRSNSLAASLLGSPEVLVTTLQLDDGSCIDVRPKALKRLRSFGIFAASLTCIVSAVWLQNGVQTAMAAVALVVSTHLARSFLDLPTSPSV